MPHDLDHAIRFAILHKPTLFGLVPEEVNPMLLYLSRILMDGEDLNEDAWLDCFQEVDDTLRRKAKEVFSGLDVVQIEGQPRVKQKLEVVEPDSKLKESKRKPASKEEIKGSPGRELSSKQLRYLGYLHRQLGDEPDYSVISKLSQQQATMRIKELEAKVNEG